MTLRMFKFCLASPGPFGLLIVVGMAGAGCDIHLDTEGYVDRVEKRYAVIGTPQLNLSTFDGAIEITGWDKPEVQVTIERRANSKEAAESIRVDASQSENSISIKAVKPAGGDRVVHIGMNAFPTATLRASVPRHTNVVAQSGDGSITASNVSGRVELRSGDGSVTARDLEGQLIVETGDGSVDADRVAGSADIDTGDGSIALHGRLAEVRARTGDGSIDVRADLKSTMTEAWEITTGDGSVEVGLPEGFGAEIDAHTSEGVIELNGVEFVAPGEVSRTTVRGRLGSGGHPLRIRTGDGAIRLQRR